MARLAYLPLSVLRFTEKKRRGVSPRRVEELRRALEDGEDMHPIRVHALGDGTFVVEDGRHRIRAHLAAGITMILAIIQNLERMWRAFARAAMSSLSHQ
jgi:ParB-like chromosome segregation protein Spo0J